MASMFGILNLFGRSPFAPLKAHMDCVSECVHMLNPLFESALKGDQKAVKEIAVKLSKLEHKADLSKNEIRGQIHPHLFMPIDHSKFLEILSIQDSLADTAEDAAVIATLRPLVFIDPIKDPFLRFLKKNIDTFEGAYAVVCELHELLESSFGGIEAKKVKEMVEGVAYLEHETDLVQRELLEILYRSDETLNHISFYQWQQLMGALSQLSNLSEKLANRIRMTLETK